MPDGVFLSLRICRRLLFFGRHVVLRDRSAVLVFLRASDGDAGHKDNDSADQGNQTDELEPAALADIVETAGGNANARKKHAE